ncbi:MAG: hypothetical protein LBB34_00300, partial [Holosporales bacterium]|jgi:hypothetical protein|nr:hypothetical protein [Holosporales bacterium]
MNTFQAVAVITVLALMTTFSIASDGFIFRKSYETRIERSDGSTYCLYPSDLQPGDFEKLFGVSPLFDNQSDANELSPNQYWSLLQIREILSHAQTRTASPLFKFHQRFFVICEKLGYPLAEGASYELYELFSESSDKKPAVPLLAIFARILRISLDDLNLLYELFDEFLSEGPPPLLPKWLASELGIPLSEQCLTIKQKTSLDDLDLDLDLQL